MGSRFLEAWERGPRGGRPPGFLPPTSPPLSLAHLSGAWGRECRAHSVAWEAYRELTRPPVLRGRSPVESSLAAKRGRGAPALSVLWDKCPLRTKPVGNRYASPLVSRVFLAGQGKRAVAPRASWEALEALGLEVGRIPFQHEGEWRGIKRRRALQVKI